MTRSCNSPKRSRPQVYALFSLMAYEDWPDSLDPFLEDDNVQYGVVVFLYSYVGIINYVLMQVFVAVLLESFFSDLSSAEVRSVRDNRVLHGLDPLMEILHRHFNTDADLSSRIEGYWNVFDRDQNGSMTFQELIIALKKLPLGKRIEMSEQQLIEMTRGILTCGEQNERRIDFQAFDRLLRQELFAFAQRNVAVSMRPPHLNNMERSFGWRKNVSLPLARLILQTEHMLGAFKVVLLAKQSYAPQDHFLRTLSGSDQGGGGKPRTDFAKDTASPVASSPIGRADSPELDQQKIQYVSSDENKKALAGVGSDDVFEVRRRRGGVGGERAHNFGESARGILSDPLVDVILPTEGACAADGRIEEQISNVARALNDIQTRDLERARLRAIEFNSVVRELEALRSRFAAASNEPVEHTPHPPDDSTLLAQLPPVAATAFPSPLLSPPSAHPPLLQPSPRQVCSAAMLAHACGARGRAGGKSNRSILSDPADSLYQSQRGVSAFVPLHHQQAEVFTCVMNPDCYTKANVSNLNCLYSTKHLEPQWQPPGPVQNLSQPTRTARSRRRESFIMICPRSGGLADRAHPYRLNHRTGQRYWKSLTSKAGWRPVGRRQ